MILQEIIDYCLEKPDTEITFPFGDVPVCMKINGRIFAEIYPHPDNYKVTLRCDPADGEYFRSAYPEIIIPGYHVPLRQRRFKITVLLHNNPDDGLLRELINRSYNEAIKRS